MADGKPAGHEQLCLSCWLRGVGIDVHVGAALIGAAFKAGQVQAWSQVVPSELAVAAAGGPVVVLGPLEVQAILRMTRSTLAMPASPDVAEAMRSDHG